MAIKLIPCKACGTRNGSDRTVCLRCGANMRKTDTEADEVYKAEEAPNAMSDKDIEATPELLAHTLLAQVFAHCESIDKHLIKRCNLQFEERMDVEIFQQLFIFYYAIFLQVIGSRFQEIFGERGRAGIDYASLFLAEARRAVNNYDLPDQYKQWVLNDDSFNHVFEQDFRFYYHDQISREDLETLDRIARICSCKERNGVLYWAVKLQHRVSKILKTLPRDDFTSFFVLWNCQSIQVTGFVKEVLIRIRPVIA